MFLSEGDILITFGKIRALPLPNTSMSLGRLSHKINTNVLPNRVSMFPVYKHECWTLGKQYGINLRCYWEHLGEYLGTWELFGILMKTSWEQEKKTKTSPALWVSPFVQHQLWTSYTSSCSSPAYSCACCGGP